VPEIRLEKFSRSRGWTIPSDGALMCTRIPFMALRQFIYNAGAN
jgi:hypothetical protein